MGRCDPFKMLISCHICGHDVLATMYDSLYVVVHADTSNKYCLKVLSAYAKQLTERLDSFWESIGGLKAVNKIYRCFCSSLC